MLHLQKWFARCEPEPAAKARADKQQVWTFTDIVGGPSASPNGPVAPLLETTGSPDVLVCLGQACVNAFDLTECFDNHGEPDLIVNFGVWPNVLTDSICRDKGVDDDQCKPSHEERRGIQNRQRTVYDDPIDFLVAVVNASIAQSAASFLLVGPRYYIWRVTANSIRPMQRFVLKRTYEDYYQGFKQMSDEFMALYLPSSSGRQVTLDTDGKVDMPYLLSLHQNVLVMSAGREKFWSNVIKHMAQEVADGSRQLAFCNDLPKWGMDHRKLHFESYMECIARGACRHCNYPQLCMRCLRRVRNWCGIPNRKWVPYSANANVGTDDMDDKDSNSACTMM